MSINKQTQYGKINFTTKAIANIVANATLECYGVVGLANKGGIRGKLDSILSKEEYTKGVSISQEKGGALIDVYVICSFGVKVTEVLSEVQKKVRYVVEKTFDFQVSKVNVFASSLKKME